MNSCEEVVLEKIIRWSEEKNQLLELQRGLNFEIVLDKIEKGEIISKMQHPNKEKYPNQEIFVVEIDGYIHYIPFVESGNEIFLKTIIPSRKLHKKVKNER